MGLNSRIGISIPIGTFYECPRCHHECRCLGLEFNIEEWFCQNCAITYKVKYYTRRETPLPKIIRPSKGER